MEKKIKEREYAQKVIKENEEKMQKKIGDKMNGRQEKIKFSKL